MKRRTNPDHDISNQPRTVRWGNWPVLSVFHLYPTLRGMDPADVFLRLVSQSMRGGSQHERGRALNTLAFYVHEIGYACRHDGSQLELVRPDGLSSLAYHANPTSRKSLTPMVSSKHNVES
jgi:hypothetical protein